MASFRSDRDSDGAKPARAAFAPRLRTGIGPMASRNLHGHVVQLLGQRIVSGKLKPGEVLPPEAVIAEEMR